MAFHGCGPVFFVLLATVFILEAYAADYQTFLRQHYDYSRSGVGGKYCNTMMKKRGMTRPKCKQVNSFIHETTNKIIAVCGDGGENYGNGLRRSKAKFSVSTCKLRKFSPKKNCQYNGGKPSERYIVIACANGKPIHYDEGQI